MTVPCRDSAASDLDKVRADIASIEVELAATRSQLTKALDALGAWQWSLALPLFAEAQTGVAKGGIESSTSHWANWEEEQPYPHGRSGSPRSTQESS